MTVAFIFGIAEGPRHARHITEALKQAGHTVITDIALADVVIAHSGGCVLVPPQLQAKAIILANPPCARRRHLPRYMIRKIYHDLAACLSARRLGSWAYKTAWNTVYMANLAQGFRMARNIRKLRYGLPTLATPTVAVVVNRRDPWRKTIASDIINRHPAYVFLALPGGHDDVWLHPHIWVNIVQYLHDA